MGLTLQQVTEFLSPFVSEYFPARYDLARPFVCGEYVAATNARVIVRIARHYLADPDCITHEGIPISLTEDIYREACRRDRNLMPISLESLMPCPLTYDRTQHCVCDDGCTQGTRGECSECEGEGVIACATCGHYEDCDDCNGKGYTDGEPCILCSGDHPTVYRIGVNDFALRVIKPICELPEIRFHHEHAERNCATFFAWQYGDGVAMPVGIKD